MRITDLNTLVTASLSDILYIIDVSDTGDFISGSSKQITVGNFFSSSNVGGGGGGSSGGSGYLILSSSVLSSSLNLESQTIISDGSSNLYTISGSFIDSSDALVFINGISQIPIQNYSISSSTLTLNGLPSSGSKIEIRRFQNDFNITYITSSMGVEYFTGNNSTTQFTLTNGQTVLHNYDVLISIDGLIQKPTTDYSITGSTLNFTVAPPNNTDIEVRYLSPQTFTFVNGSGGGGTSLITGSTYPITSSWSNNSITASYALTSAGGGGGSGTGFPFSGSAVITGSLLVSGSGISVSGSLNVKQTIVLNDTTISASSGTLYLNGTPLRIITFAYFSSSISSSTETGILKIRDDLLQGRSLLNGNIYVNNLSSASNATINIYNSSTLGLFQTETVGASQNLILTLSDFIPLTVSGSGNFTFQITSSVT
jgi:hypothetical protein